MADEISERLLGRTEVGAQAAYESQERPGGPSKYSRDRSKHDSVVNANAGRSPTHLLGCSTPCRGSGFRSLLFFFFLFLRWASPSAQIVLELTIPWLQPHECRADTKESSSILVCLTSHAAQAGSTFLCSSEASVTASWVHCLKGVGVARVWDSAVPLKRSSRRAEPSERKGVGWATPETCTPPQDPGAKHTAGLPGRYFLKKLTCSRVTYQSFHHNARAGGRGGAPTTRVRIP